MSARSKTQERRVGRFFGVNRTPLSGGASRHTRSDTLHPDLFLEVKSAIAPRGTNGWLYRLVLGLKSLAKEMHYFCFDGLYVAHTSLIEPDVVYRAIVGAHTQPACLRLWKQTQELAAQEKKIPLLALCVKGRRGFWLVGDAESILAAQAARKETVENEQSVECG